MKNSFLCFSSIKSRENNTSLTSSNPSFKEGYSIKELYNKTKIDPWFLSQLQIITTIDIKENFKKKNIKYLKKEGFSF